MCVVCVCVSMCNMNKNSSKKSMKKKQNGRQGVLGILSFCFSLGREIGIQF